MSKPDPKLNVQASSVESQGSSPKGFIPDGQDLAQTTEILEAIIDDRGLLLQLSPKQLERFLKAAGQVAHPGRAAKRRLVKAVRQQRRQQMQSQKESDEALLDKTGIRLSQQDSIRRFLESGFF